MFKMRLSPLFLLALAAVIAIGAVPALAQTDDLGDTVINEFELIGVVADADADTITLGGHVINMTQAMIRTNLQLGTMARVRVMLQPDGSLVALAADAAPAQVALQAGEYEMIGRVWAFDDSTVVIGGQFVAVDEALRTQLQLRMGMQLRVRVRRSQTGAPVATEVAADNAYDWEHEYDWNYDWSWSGEGRHWDDGDHWWSDDGHWWSDDEGDDDSLNGAHQGDNAGQVENHGEDPGEFHGSDDAGEYHGEDAGEHQGDAEDHGQQSGDDHGSESGQSHGKDD